VDAAGTRVHSAEFCVFTNAVFMRGIPSMEAIFKIDVDEMGNAVKYNFDKQRYYFYIPKKVVENIYFNTGIVNMEDKVL
jgi:hypothetical protein